MRIHNKLNPEYYRALLEDKYLFDRFISSHKFPLVKTRAIIENGFIRWLDGNINEALENIINYNLDGYIKMLTSWGGNLIYKINIHDRKLFINNKPSSIESLRNDVDKKIFILQDRVKQHYELERLNPSCANTIRMITVHNGSNALNFSNMLRIGVNGSLVDNLSQGGLGCAIYPDGSLHGKAYDKTGMNQWIVKHPDTNTEFAGFKIPYYDEALKLVVKMHEAFHCFFMIAWDIIITDSGPVVLEGNPIGEIIYLQSFYGKGIKKEIKDLARMYETARSSIIR